MSLPVPLTLRVGSTHLTRECSSLSFREEAVGGVRSITFRLFRPLTQLDGNLASFSPVTIYDGRTAEPVAQGKLSDTGRSAGSDGQVWEITAFGPAQHAADQSLSLVYRALNLDTFERDGLGTPSDANAQTEVSTFPGSDQPALLIQFNEAAMVNTGSFGGMASQMVQESDMTLGGFKATYDAGAVSANYDLWASTGDAVNYYEVPAVVNMTSVAATLTKYQVTDYPAGRSRLRFSFRRSAGGAAVAGALVWATFADIVLLGRRKDKAGTLQVHSTLDVYAHDVVSDLLGRMLPEFDGAGATVDTSGAYLIDQMAYPDGVSATQVLDDLMLLEPAFRWTTYPKATPGYGFRWEPWPTTVRYEASMDDGGSFPVSTQDLFNRVTVRWKDTRGVTHNLLVTGSCPLLDDRGLIRTPEIIDLSDEIGSQANAQRVGDAFLADHKVPKNSGTLQISRPIRDVISGRLVNPWEIKTGELIRVRGVEAYLDSLNADQSDGQSVFRIWAKDYSTDGNTASLELDSPSRTTAAALVALMNARSRKR